jgi:hypothetical protein
LASTQPDRGFRTSIRTFFDGPNCAVSGANSVRRFMPSQWAGLWSTPSSPRSRKTGAKNIRCTAQPRWHQERWCLSPCRIGITFCPGKYNPHALTGSWDRDLALDLDAVQKWGASAVVTLIEGHELELLRVSNLGKEVRRRGMSWFHLPIADVSVPDSDFEQAWKSASHELRLAMHGQIIAGDRVREFAIRTMISSFGPVSPNLPKWLRTPTGRCSSRPCTNSMTAQTPGPSSC